MTTSTVPLEAVLAEYLDDLAAAKRKPRTIEIANTYTHRLIDWLEAEGHSTEVNAITTTVLRGYFAHLGETLSGTTSGIHYRTLRAVFNWLEKEEEIARSPFKRLTEPKAETNPVPVFTTADLKALLATTAGKSYENRRDRAMLYVLIDSGVRLGELLSMTGAGILIEQDRCVVIVEGKTGKRPAAITSPDALQALRRFLRARAGHEMAHVPDLWIGKKGALTESGVAQLLKRRGREAGVAGVRPHRFRHTFAHRQLLDGRPEGEVMALGGWKTEQMMRHYGKSAAFERALDARRHGSPADDLT